MTVPLLSGRTRSTSPARTQSALIHTPPRPWRSLPEGSKSQIASILADMVKRMAASVPEGRGDAGDQP
jgi:hypothetical protein